MKTDNNSSAQATLRSSAPIWLDDGVVIFTVNKSPTRQMDALIAAVADYSPK